MSVTVDRRSRSLRRVLFVCTDNWLDSRFCEEYFNSLARTDGLNWIALSRTSAAPTDRDVAIAPAALAALRALKTAPVNHHRPPLALSRRDVEISDLVVYINHDRFSRAKNRCVQWATGTGKDTQSRLQQLTELVRDLFSQCYAGGPPLAAHEIAAEPAYFDPSNCRGRVSTQPEAKRSQTSRPQTVTIKTRLIKTPADPRSLARPDKA